MNANQRQFIEKRFDHERDAREVAEAMSEGMRDGGLGYCPQIRKRCRISCIAYYPPEVVRVNTGWAVSFARCDFVRLFRGRDRAEGKK